MPQESPNKRKSRTPESAPPPPPPPPPPPAQVSPPPPPPVQHVSAPPSLAQPDGLVYAQNGEYYLADEAHDESESFERGEAPSETGARVQNFADYLDSNYGNHAIQPPPQVSPSPPPPPSGQGYAQPPAQQGGSPNPYGEYKWGHDSISGQAHPQYAAPPDPSVIDGVTLGLEGASQQPLPRRGSPQEATLMPMIELFTLSAGADTTQDFNKREVQRQAAMALCRIDVPKKRAEALMDALDDPFAGVRPEPDVLCSEIKAIHPLPVRAAIVEYCCVLFFTKSDPSEEEIDFLKRCAERLDVPTDALVRIFQRVKKYALLARQAVMGDDTAAFKALHTHAQASPDKIDSEYRKLCVFYHPLRVVTLSADQRRSAFQAFVTGTLALGKLKRVL